MLIITKLKLILIIIEKTSFKMELLICN